MPDSEDKVIDEINTLLKNAATKRLDSEADKDIRFWLEVAPYMSVLGLSMPKNPGSILSLPSLMEGLTSSTLQKKSDSLAENLQATVAKKAFSAHQIIGILKKYDYIHAEDCTPFREHVFMTATKINYAIDKSKGKIDSLDKTSKKIKKWGGELLKEYGMTMMEEAGEMVPDSIVPSLGKLVDATKAPLPDCGWMVMDSHLSKKMSDILEKSGRSMYVMGEHGLSYYDKLTGNLQKIKLDQKSLKELTEEFKGLGDIKRLSDRQINQIMSITHQNPESTISLYECFRTLYNVKKFRDSLENKYKYDEKKGAAYDECIKEYITEQNKSDNLQKLGGMFARLENEEEILDAKIKAVANDDLGLGYKSQILKKVNKVASDFSTYVDTAFSKTIAELSSMEAKLGKLHVQYKEALNQILMMDDKDININSLTDFQEEFKVVEILKELEQVQKDAKELRDITIKGRNDAIDYEKFYTRVNTVLKNVERLESGFEKINAHVGEIKNSFLQLHDDIGKYYQRTVHSTTREIARTFKKNLEGSGKTKSEKKEAATTLANMVVGVPEATPIPPSFELSTSEGKLGALAKNFSAYKERFKDVAKDAEPLDNTSPAPKSK